MSAASVLAWSLVLLMTVAAAGAGGGARVCEDHAGKLTAVREGDCPSSAPKEVRLAGANIFDSWWAFCEGMPSAGTPADSLTALQAAKSTGADGVRFFRFFAGLWGPDMKYWIQNEESYWKQLDAWYDQLEKVGGLYGIPSLGYGDGWSSSVNAAFPQLNETVNDAVANRSSLAYKLALKYFGQYVRRYANRDVILFWELGNELNLMVNLPPPWCGDKQCFNTAEMVAYTKDLVAVIRAIDSRRPISSGFSAPRPTAWHQEHCPLSGHCPADPTSKGYWAIDSLAQWQSMLAAQNEGIDIWSIHHYQSPDNCFFSTHECIWNATVAAVAAEQAEKSGAMLYVGEYGGPSPNFTGPLPSDQVFPQAILDVQVENAKANGAFKLSTIWAWECPSHRNDMVCIYPGSTHPKEAGSDRMVGIIEAANKALMDT